MAQFRDRPGDISNASRSRTSRSSQTSDSNKRARERAAKAKKANAAAAAKKKADAAAAAAKKDAAERKAHIAAREADKQRTLAAARQKAGQQSSEMMAANKKRGDQFAKYGATIFGVSGALTGNPLVSLAGKAAGSEAGRAFAKNFDETYPGPNPQSLRPGWGESQGSIGQGQTSARSGERGGNTYGAANRPGISQFGSRPSSAIGPTNRPSQAFKPGQSALQQQQTMLGMNGLDAQNQSFDAFANSPGQQFLRDRQERALMRNAAAMGGLGGGNVRQALQDQAAGNAMQDYNNQFNRLGQVADREFRATLNEQQLAQMNQQMEAGKTEGMYNLIGSYSEPISDIFAGIGSGIADWAGW